MDGANIQGDTVNYDKLAKFESQWPRFWQDTSFKVAVKSGFVRVQR